MEPEGTAASTAPSAPDEEAAAPAEAASTSSGPTTAITIIYGKNKQEVERPLNSTVGELKKIIAETTRIEPSGQKLLNKGVPLKDDDATLEKAGLGKPGTKLMLIGTPAPEVAATQKLAEVSAITPMEEDSKQSSEENLCKQTQHQKVLAKGKPEDALPGLKGRQVPLADEVKIIPGLLNSQGTKVRLTFKPELSELVIASAAHTQRVPYTSITKIEAYPIPDQEEYSVLAVRLGTGTYYLYWFPSQHVASLKIRILGVESLL
eukprot:CAMPEP_0202887988 /NCGR_PEP_ID=MMETSP1391-20130828/42962_1 /ASSEMBLY_ACC=CAM_ASM_000867 /TAXON_ID=1034604 /ORGANISM="Chlamydomonas leiostraca, Strain SAG 11-49" /LENGTH=262 /DNA_ID=CAMNT_0049571291 /DNA_START=2367 /DNA_END=3155 /DNA_ORIENTATION=-